MQTKKFLALLFVMFFLSGCAWWKSKEMPKNNPEALYQKGYEDYQKGRYEKAIESFQKLKEEYPLSELALRAELGIADANFSREEYGYAAMAYNDFVNLHPTNENTPYVMYQIGMCRYNQMLIIDRDQTETVAAAKEFEKLIARFPTSRFSFLAEKNLRECKKKLAEHEFYVGEIYFKMKQYKAALKRFDIIVKNYPNLGLDYKVSFMLEETKKQLAIAEAKSKGK